MQGKGMQSKNCNNQVQKLLDFVQSNIKFFEKPTVMHLTNKYLIHMTPTLSRYFINER